VKKIEIVVMKQDSPNAYSDAGGNNSR